MQQPGELTKLLESVRAADSIEALRTIVAKQRTPLEEIEETEPFRSMPYGKLRELLEAGRSYFFFQNLLGMAYFSTIVGILVMFDLGIQFLTNSTRPEGIVVSEALGVVFGVLMLIVFAPLSRTAVAEHKQEFESATGMAVTRQSMTILENVASDVHRMVDIVLARPEKIAPQWPLTLEPSEFNEMSRTLFQQQHEGGISDMFDVTSEGVRVWREQEGGLNPRYLIAPYLITWERLRYAVDHDEEIHVGSLSASSNAVKQLLELEQRLE